MSKKMTYLLYPGKRENFTTVEIIHVHNAQQFRYWRTRTVRPPSRVMPPIMIFTGSPRRASFSAALSAPLQCGPAQYTTNSVSAGHCAMRLSNLARGHMYRAGHMTTEQTAQVSRQHAATQSPCSLFVSAWCTSAQSVSTLRRRRKWVTASLRLGSRKFSNITHDPSSSLAFVLTLLYQN